MQINIYNKAVSNNCYIFLYLLMDENTKIERNHFARLYCFYTFIISEHFRYIYSTNVIHEQGIVKGCKSSTEICIFTELPCLGRPIVEAEVRTCFLSFNDKKH